MTARLLKLWALAMMLAACAHGAESLSAVVTTVGGRARANAPQSLEVELNWRGSGLLEGVLEVSDADSVAGLVCRSPEMVLSNGLRKFRMLMPPVWFSYDELNPVALRFRTASRIIELGRFTTGIRSQGGRHVVICVGAPQVGGSRSPLWSGLRLESLEPPQPAASSSSKNPTPIAAVTVPVYLDPEEFPTDPLAYCGYDVVLLEGETFSKLRPKQLAALRIWVRAGASLCVVPAAELPVDQSEFLRGLRSAPSAATAAPAGDAPQCFGSGLGRVVVLSHTSPALYTTDIWKNAVAFLWKRRAADPDRYGSSANSYLYRSLMPEEVRVLPRAAIFAILGGLLLAVGPVDYLLLGKLRRRVWTWLLLPVLALGSTALITWLAGWYMGSRDYRSALVVSDLGSDGQIVRETRIEMLFVSRPGSVQTSLRNVLWQAMSDYRQRGTPLEPAVVAGQFPARYVVTQSLRQWAPQLNRMTSLLEVPDASNLPWELIAKLDANGPEGNAARGAFSPEKENCDAMCLRAALKSTDSPLQYDHLFSQERAIVPRQLLTALTLRYARNGLSAVWQISPNGAGNLEDLAMLDPDQPAARVLIAVRRERDIIHIYRKLKGNYEL